MMTSQFPSFDILLLWIVKRSPRLREFGVYLGGYHVHRGHRLPVCVRGGAAMRG